jgi:VWFA-related protein
MGKRIGMWVFFWFVCVADLAFPAFISAQESGKSAPASPAAQSSPTPVFRATSRLVLLDVIVTDHHGQFIPGLQAADFTVLEDHKPQKISSLTLNAVPATPAAYPRIELPPHQFSNFSFAKPESDPPVTVVLLDLLNTSVIDQSYTRTQMIRFLETLPEGRPVALFVLTSQLRMIQGFSGDSGTIVAAARNLLRYQSQLLSPEIQPEGVAGVGPVDQGPTPIGRNPQLTSMSLNQAIRSSSAAQESFQQLQRMRLTLGALDALAQAVAGYPGRKNLIWLSANFPIAFGPDFERLGEFSNSLTATQRRMNPQVRDLAAEAPPIQQTAALLAAARMAVYPIDVRGQILSGPGPNARTTAIWDTHDAMNDIARETGGRAFYGTNDLKEAMARSVQQGSTYYTISYVPTNRDWNGKYRKIEVKGAAPGRDLTYRHGYYAFQERGLAKDKAEVAMTAALQLSVPDFTGLLLKVQVLPPDENHKAVRIDYAVNARDVNFSDSTDKRRVGSVDFAVSAWDKQFKLVEHKLDTMEMTLRPPAYEQVMQTGLPFHQELELKPGTYTLRIGTLDRNSHKIGSLSASITVPENLSSNNPSDGTVKEK